MRWSGEGGDRGERHSVGGRGRGFGDTRLAWHDRELRGLIMLQGIHSA